MRNVEAAYCRTTRNGPYTVATFSAGNVASQPRTTEAGARLYVTAVKPSGSMNRLGGHHSRHVYGHGHLTVPTISEYHTVAKPLTQLEADIRLAKSTNLMVLAAHRMPSFAINATKTGMSPRPDGRACGVVFYCISDDVLRHYIARLPDLDCRAFGWRF